jgi:rhamnose utilization protein RhaD (predicted bifunctional aldolase and dehydrogenase)/NAD(P)-dependent dehydrogenase (short-subunit alcohol dehydrogenase family)
MVDRYGEAGVSEDLALRVYTSRLLGRDPQLVIHGGGNTSVKTTMKDFLGESCEVLCVKGSGWDLSTIEPQGLPAVRLDPLRRLRSWERLSDEDMVAFLRSNLLDPTAPNPSIETLLHAYLPHKFVDHAHATAVLSVSDQPNGEQLCREIFGERLAVVPFVMPGFELSKVTADAYEASPAVHGVILHKHGIFTFGETARESYERMIAAVTMAEDFISRAARKVFVAADLPSDIAAVPDVAPIVRGACAEALGDGDYRRLILHHRSSKEIRSYVDGRDLARYGTRGVVTPDHIIRTKNKPLIVPAPAAGRLGEFKTAVFDAVERYRQDYERYFQENNARQAQPRIQLDPMPRVVLVPGVGLFGLGKNAAGAAVAADLAEIAITTITDAETVGRYEALEESELFDMEYWSLEQAKLGKGTEKPLSRQVALITGAGGTIGAATAQLFAENGAEVVILDKHADAARQVADAIGGAALAVACDVTDANAVRVAFDETCRAFGGVDILVSNAGAAWQGPIGELDDEALRASFELNFFAHQTLAKNAVRVMKAQQTGGVLLFNASKQAVNPGANFGAYGLPKAATLFLSRQYALEYGALGIRSNAVNADRIRGGLLTDDMVESRAEQRGVTPEDYLAGNLLHHEVKAEDVARCFLHLSRPDLPVRAFCDRFLHPVARCPRALPRGQRGLTRPSRRRPARKSCRSLHSSPLRTPQASGRLSLFGDALILTFDIICRRKRTLFGSMPPKMLAPSSGACIVHCSYYYLCHRHGLCLAHSH